jgi:hypothetical protein
MPIPGSLPGSRIKNHTHSVAVTEAGVHAACNASGAVYSSQTVIGTRTVTTTTAKSPG